MHGDTMDFQSNYKAKLISKAAYLDFLDCPQDSWLKFNKPALYAKIEEDSSEKRYAQKYDPIDTYVQNLTVFGGGIDVNTVTGDKVALTKQHIDQTYPVIFNPVFVYEGFLVRPSVLKYDEQLGEWNIYDIKRKSKPKEKDKKEFESDIGDAAFDIVVLQKQGVKIGRISIMYLNRGYIRGSELEIEQLFEYVDITEEVRSKISATFVTMANAKDLLLRIDESIALDTCDCRYKGRNSQCLSFKTRHPHVPWYSVYDIARIRGEKLKSLVDTNIFDINDISRNVKLSEIQRNQVDTYQQKKTIINVEKIAGVLKGLEYPMYFLDYETYASAIPLYQGVHPYQQVPVQFSLHVIDVAHSTPVHFEYLHMQSNDSSLNIIEKLKQYIGPKGRVVVWNESFEKMINRELSERHPEHKAFLDDLNNRMYDLAEIFEDQLYVDAQFKGSTSIKNILPVLAPELRYGELNIQNGSDASQKWFEMVFGGLTVEAQQKIAYDLRKYCCLDTYAMYAIWKRLANICDTHMVAKSPAE